MDLQMVRKMFVSSMQSKIYVSVLSTNKIRVFVQREIVALKTLRANTSLLLIMMMSMGKINC